jgi:hypothetical protein
LTPTDLQVVNAEPQSLEVLAIRRNRLVQAAETFYCRLNKLHGHVRNKFKAIVYFDEAHTLQVAVQDKGRSPYFALMHVLSTLANTPIFFIFLSTNSSLNALAPTGVQYPSLRVQAGWKLIPPFFELPFDSFCSDFTATVRKKGKLTLNGVCELEQMVKFGRPM